MTILGCTTAQEQQAATFAAALANTAGVAYATYTAATTGSLTPAQAITAYTTASADLSGIASLAQAYVGSAKTPTTANLASGAANPAPAQAVVATLPNAAITQSTVNSLYKAAALVAAKAK